MPPIPIPFFFFWVLYPTLHPRCFFSLGGGAVYGLSPIANVVPSMVGLCDSPGVVNSCGGPRVGSVSVVCPCVAGNPDLSIGPPSLSLKNDEVDFHSSLDILNG